MRAFRSGRPVRAECTAVEMGREQRFPVSAGRRQESAGGGFDTRGFDMKIRFLGCLTLIAALSMLLPVVAAAQGDLEVSGVDWATNAGIVRFHVQFHNTGTLLTEAVSGELSSQAYGAFVPVLGTIGTFNVPPLMPESFFDVFFDVPLSSLPPSATKITPWDNKSQAAVCGPDDHWDGNVDIRWVRLLGGGVVGHANAHFGHLLVCPGSGHSYIHVITACAGLTNWWFANVCAGWHVQLLNENYTPAPSPLPAGWTGFIDVWADASVPIGAICCITLNLNCNGVTVPVVLCAEACDCSTVGIEQSTWSTIKSLYR